MKSLYRIESLWGSASDQIRPWSYMAIEAESETEAEKRAAEWQLTFAEDFFGAKQPIQILKVEKIMTDTYTPYRSATVETPAYSPYSVELPSALEANRMTRDELRPVAATLEIPGRGSMDAVTLRAAVVRELLNLQGDEGVYTAYSSFSNRVEDDGDFDEDSTYEIETAIQRVYNALDALVELF